MANARLLSPSASLPPSLQRSTNHLNPVLISHSAISNSFFFRFPNKFLNPRPLPSAKPLKSFSPSCPTTITSSDAGVGNWETRPNSSNSEEPSLRLEEDVKVPTAPWMRGPFHLPRSEVLDLSDRRRKTKKQSSDVDVDNPGRVLTGKVSGARGRKAMKKIFEGIGKLRQSVQSKETDKLPEEIGDGLSFEDLGCNRSLRTLQSQEIEENPVQIGLNFSFGELDENEIRKFRAKVPWESEERAVFRRTKKEKVVTAAEMFLDAELLERLRGEARKMRRWISVRKAGVTENVVDQIRLIWKTDELAMLKFDIPLCRNMDRAREIVEVPFSNLYFNSECINFIA